jgi:hypothetical protein
MPWFFQWRLCRCGFWNSLPAKRDSVAGGSLVGEKVNASLMFHAPYTRSDKDPNKITCSKNLTNVANYYREMLGEKLGERMFDRTKRYCSATDGWIISDQNAAKLYGLHTTTVFDPSR